MLKTFLSKLTYSVKYGRGADAKWIQFFYFSKLWGLQRQNARKEEPTKNPWAKNPTSTITRLFLHHHHVPSPVQSNSAKWSIFYNKRKSEVLMLLDIGRVTCLTQIIWKKKLEKIDNFPTRFDSPSWTVFQFMAIARSMRKCVGKKSGWLSHFCSAGQWREERSNLICIPNNISIYFHPSLPPPLTCPTSSNPSECFFFWTTCV